MDNLNIAADAFFPVYCSYVKSVSLDLATVSQQQESRNSEDVLEIIRRALEDEALSVKAMSKACANLALLNKSHLSNLENSIKELFVGQFLEKVARGEELGLLKSNWEILERAFLFGSCDTEEKLSYEYVFVEVLNDPCRAGQRTHQWLRALQKHFYLF